ncbi:hypothetical protein ES703_85490 [subsurface metagenome]
MVAQGWNVYSVFPGNFKDILFFFSLNFFTIELKSDHRVSLLLNNNGTKLTGIVTDAALNALVLI